MGCGFAGVVSAISLKAEAAFKNWNGSHKCKAIKRNASQEPRLLPNLKYFNDFIVALYSSLQLSTMPRTSTSKSFQCIFSFPLF